MMHEVYVVIGAIVFWGVTIFAATFAVAFAIYSISTRPDWKEGTK